MNLIAETLAFPALYSVTPDATKSRDKMLLAADAVLKPITTAAENDLVARAGSTLQTHKKEVQEARLAITRKLDAEKAKIMQVERDYLAPIDEKLKALGVQATAWNEKENERVAKEEAARREEYQKLERERLEALAKAERARKEESQLKHELTAHNAEQAQESLIREVLPTVAKAKNATTKRELKHDVIDAKKVYSVRPELCSVEVKASAVKAVVTPREDATEISPDKDTVPGLSLWWHTDTSFRRTR